MTQHVNDHMMNVVGPAINDGLAAYFKGDPLDPSDPTIAAAYRLTDATLDPVKGLPLTFTRASPAMVWSDRILKQVSANVPRFPGATYTGDVYTGKAQGLQLEPPATNICLQSEDFAAAPWAVGLNGLIDSNQMTAPDGTVSADLLIDDASGGEGQCLVSQNVTLLPSTEYTLTKYYRASGLGWANLRMGNLGTLTIEAYFQLSGDGVVGPTRGANNTSEFIENIGDGWYKCGIQFTSDAVDTAGSIQTYLCDTDGDRVVTLNGSSSILMWGSELKAGPPSSYIKTTTVPADRAGEVCFADITGLGINTLAGTAYARFAVGGTSAVGYYWEVSDGTTNERIYQFNNPSNGFVRATSSTNAVNEIVMNSGPPVNVRSSNKIALGWAFNDVAACINGSLISDATYDPAPAVSMTRLYLGQLASGGQFNGVLAEIAISTERKPNDELQRITTP